MENLNEISKQVYEANKLNGIDVKNENIGQTLCLIHSEISEALEAIRINKRIKYDELNTPTKSLLHNKTDYIFKEYFERDIKNTFEDKIADTFIRLFDLCGAFEIDIDKHIELKRRYNTMRGFKHDKLF